MKTRILTILLAFSMLFQTSDIFAPPSLNPDWQGAPYYPGEASIDFYKEEWAKYYDIKGAEWMETKKAEMLASIENGTLNEWLDEPTMAHNNVHTYYFYDGKIPNHEGKFLDQIVQERFFSDTEQNLKNNRFPLGGHMFVNLTFLLIVIGSGIIVGVVFTIRRKK